MKELAMVLGKHGKTVGFTIVELLIVIVVIAILAAVSIIAYNGIQNRARSSEASAALTQAKKKLEVYKVDNTSYPSSGNLSSAGISNGSVTYQYSSLSNGSSYCLTASTGSVSYNISPASSPGEGACIGHTSSGSTMATNLMASSSFEGTAPGWYSNWTNYVGGSISQVAGAGVITGDTAMELTVTASNQSGTRYVVLPALSPNTTYTFSIYVTPISGDIANLGINVGDGAGTRANNNFATSLTAGQTVRKSVTWTSSAGPGTTQIAVFRFAAGTGPATFRFDAAMLEVGASATAYNT